MKGKLITGKRILLRPAKLSDARELAQYFNETKHYLGADIVKDMTIEAEKKFIRDANKNPNLYFFVITLLESQTVIGSISITDINIHDSVAYTGTMIGESYTNRGYGTEAKHLLLDFAFNTLCLRKLYSKVYGYNERSRNYSLKCGYVQEATLFEKKWYDGKYWDEWILSVNKDQWIEQYNNYKRKHL